jgi:hypothetical protein
MLALTLCTRELQSDAQLHPLCQKSLLPKNKSLVKTRPHQQEREKSTLSPIIAFNGQLLKLPDRGRTNITVVFDLMYHVLRIVKVPAKNRPRINCGLTEKVHSSGLEEHLSIVNYSTLDRKLLYNTIVKRSRRILWYYRYLEILPLTLNPSPTRGEGLQSDPPSPLCGGRGKGDEG